MVCATRELEEETGWKSEHVEKLLQLKTTVAFCNEFIDVYLATDLTPGVQKLDEGEEIEIVSMPLDEAVQKIYCGRNTGCQDGGWNFGISEQTAYRQDS